MYQCSIGLGSEGVFVVSRISYYIRVFFITVHDIMIEIHVWLADESFGMCSNPGG